MNEVLMLVVVDTVEFFANCGDDELDPDIAVGRLEAIAFQLQQLPDKDKERFIEFSRELSNSIRQEDSERASFIESVPENLGLSL